MCCSNSYSKAYNANDIALFLLHFQLSILFSFNNHSYINTIIKCYLHLSKIYFLNCGIDIFFYFSDFCNASFHSTTLNFFFNKPEEVFSFTIMNYHFVSGYV